MLNKYQQEVVDNLGRGCVIVDAGPGSGKTTTARFLVERILQKGVYSPQRMLCVTFSVKAAAELRSRIAKTLFPDASPEELLFWENPNQSDEEGSLSSFDADWVNENPTRVFLKDWVCTIHALSFRLLKEHGLKYNVLGGRNKMEVDNIIKDTIDEIEYDQSKKTVEYYIAYAVGNLVEYNNVYDFYLRVTGSAYHANALTRLYKRYIGYMRRCNLVDFNMMQAECLKLLRNDSGFRNKAQSMFDFVLVDEYQDTGSIQNEMLFAIANKSRNITVIGDCDQSLYAFRGARPEMILSGFEKYWNEKGSETKRFQMPTNYRSQPYIVDGALRVIKNNYLGDKEKYLKNLHAHSDVSTRDFEYVETGEFEELCDEIVNKIAEDGNFGNWFVLSRTRAECEYIHAKLAWAKIPAINKSGGAIFGTPHIRKVLAYAQLASNYRNARNSVETISEIANVASDKFLSPINKRSHVESCRETRFWVDCGCPVIHEKGVTKCHTRYYGKKSVEKARGWSGIKSQASQYMRGEYTTTALGAQDLLQFVDTIEKLADNAHECLAYIIEHSIVPFFEREEGLSNSELSENGKGEDFNVLLNIASKFGTVDEFLDEIESMSSNGDGDDENSVLVGTIHWSKGAERPNVLVNATRLPIKPPFPKDGELETTPPPTIEEERRLFYVAMTRAKEKVVIARSFNFDFVPQKQNYIFVEELSIKE